MSNNVYLNGWTREKMLEQIEERNGFEIVLSDNGNSCVYRNSDDMCCLVGAFIPDHAYNPNMDKTGVSNTSAQYVIPQYNLAKYMPLSPENMCKLQNLHDCHSANPSNSLQTKINDFLNLLEDGHD